MTNIERLERKEDLFFFQSKLPSSPSLHNKSCVHLRKTRSKQKRETARCLHLRETKHITHMEQQKKCSNPSPHACASYAITCMTHRSYGIHTHLDNRIKTRWHCNLVGKNRPKKTEPEDQTRITRDLDQMNQTFGSRSLSWFLLAEKQTQLRFFGPLT